MNIADFPAFLDAVYKAAMSEHSIYKLNQRYLEEKFKEYKIDSKSATELLAKTNSEMTISITAVCINAVVELMKTKIQSGLADGEKEFNAARTALVQAQTITEGKKANLVDREKASFDDNLKIKEAESLSNVVGMYAAGGMAIPGELNKTMLDAISKLTK